MTAWALATYARAMTILIAEDLVLTKREPVPPSHASRFDVYCGPHSTDTDVLTSRRTLDGSDVGSAMSAFMYSLRKVTASAAEGKESSVESSCSPGHVNVRPGDWGALNEVSPVAPPPTPVPEGPALRVAPELADPVGPLEVGEHQDVEQLGAGSGSEGVQTWP